MLVRPPLKNRMMNPIRNKCVLDNNWSTKKREETHVNILIEVGTAMTMVATLK